MAGQNDRDLLISGGPRARPEFYDVPGPALLSHHRIRRPRPDAPANPFDLMVKGATDSVVTAQDVAAFRAIARRRQLAMKRDDDAGFRMVKLQAAFQRGCPTP